MEEPRHEDDTRELDAEEIRAEQAPPRAPEPAPGERAAPGEGRSWSPAEVVSLALGVFFLVLGGVGLARAGFVDLTAHVSVAGFHHTPILAIAEVILGLALLGMGATPGAGRSGMVFLGGLMVAFGIVLVLQAESFHAVLGTHTNNGWLFTLLGGLQAAVALWGPSGDG